MIPANHEVAREQFAFPENNYFAPTEKEAQNTSVNIVQEDNGRIILKAGEITIGFNKWSGALNEYTFAGKRLLAAGPEPDFWRAPTDNDFGNRMPEICNIWRAAGKNKTVDKFNVNNTGKEVIITVDYTLKDVSSPYTVKYTVSGNGTIQVHVSWKAGRKELPEIPRFGMRMQLSPEFETFTYYGRGPWENYSDRNTSSFIGVYNSSVTEQTFDYIRPQENGNKTDVRWLSLTNKEGYGLKIKGLQPLSVKAAHNSTEDLDFGETKKNTHPSDITPQKGIFLNVDYLQRGLGGDDSWHALPHNPYRLLGDYYEYRYEISAVHP
jgi:beta-galactosidase